MKVVKFGGSSLASAEQLRKVLNIVREDQDRRFVVVSAPGKRNSEDAKVTDLLISYYDAYVNQLETQNICEQIVLRYAEMAQELGVSGETVLEIQDNLLSLTNPSQQGKEHLYDAFLASGENNNAILIAAYFKNEGLPARYINPKELGILVTDEPGGTRISNDSYDRIYKWREHDEVLVIPGFFGYNEANQISTFSRGGSDITGSIVAAGLQADLYENFTDVDGIFAAHPGVVHEPEMIHELTFREMRELAYAGFTVFHDEALMPCYKVNIPVVIKNTNNPSAPGTTIKNQRSSEQRPVVGIASDSGFASLYINKYLMNKEVGFVRKILQIFEELDISYEHMPSGIDDISIIIREFQLTPEKEESLLRRIAYDLDPDEIKLTHGLSVIMIVGEGMRQRVGIMSESTAALARKSVNLEMVNQGSSEVSIMFGIHTEDEARAIKGLYYTFFD